ncbi:MAG: hypothetical protein HY043_05415 [Verrucomicrobia bacterium]|nr:hypothetical protein [Verrucomicrobiota bacterium]
MNLWLTSVVSIQAQPKFEPLVLDAGRPKLSLLGQSGTNYVIESSVNLSNWTFLFSGVATNGRVSYLHSAAPAADRLFYRAHSGAAPPAPAKIDPRANTNAITGALVTFEDGGNCTLLGNNGQLFTLTFPSNTIPTPAIIKMTLVTNIAGLPFSRGIIGAVRLEPEKLDIFGAATLDISYPTNSDWRQIVSFTCGNDGSDFHLTPDLVRSNYVRIPLTHFGTFGSCLATTQELAQVVQSASENRNRSQTIAKLDLHGARGRIALQDFLSSSLICFSERVARAQIVFDHLTNLRRDSEQDLAALLAWDRTLQLFGAPSNSSNIVKNAAAEACPIYRDQLAPYWPEAANNCALNGILLMFTLGIERQLEVLGFVDEGGTCTSIKNQPLCAGFETCLKEIEECCKRTSQGSGRLQDLFDVHRQQLLLGLNCLSPDDIKRVQDACTNLSWVGTFTVKEHGQTNSTSSVGNTTYEHTSSYRLEFEGNVINSTEESFGDFGEFGFAIILKVFGQFYGYRMDRDITTRPDSCGADISDGTTEHEANVSGGYDVQIIFDPNGTYTIYAKSVSDVLPNSAKAHGCGSIRQYDDRGRCTGYTMLCSSSQIPSSRVIFNPAQLYLQLSGTNTSRVSGSVSTNTPFFVPPKTESYTWDFQRTKKPQ